MTSEAAVIASESKQGMRGYITAHPLALLLPLAAALALLRFDPNPTYTWDDSVYTLLTHAFRHGLGKVLISDSNMAAPVVQSIGLPALLTPIALLWENPIAYKLTIVGIYLLGIAAIYRLFSTNFGAWVGLFVTVSYALNVYTIQYASQIIAEIPYVLFSVLACAALLLYQRANRVIGWELLVAAVALNAAIYMRSVGLALLVAGVIWLVWQGAWRKAVALPLIALLISIPLQLGWVLGSPSGWAGGYVDYLGINHLSLSEQVSQNLVGYAFNLVRLLIELPYTSLYNAPLPTDGLLFVLLLTLLMVVPLGLIALGMIRERTPAGSLLGLYVVIYMGVLLVWPYAPHPRFALPILPMLLFFLLRGWVEALKQAHWQRERAAVVGLLVVVAGFSLIQQVEAGVVGGDNLAKNVAEYAQPAHYPPSRETYIEAALWLAAHTRADAVVLCGDPYDFYLWSGLHTLGYYSTSDTAGLLQNSDYLVANYKADGSATAVGSYVAAHPERLQLIYKVDGPAPAIVYRVIKANGLARLSVLTHFTFYLLPSTGCFAYPCARFSRSGYRQQSDDQSPVFGWQHRRCHHPRLPRNRGKPGVAVFGAARTAGQSRKPA